MFANQTFIESTRGFVCVRVETYKYPEMDRMMSEMFRGKLPNSAFCLFDPTGKKRLCEPSRSPHSLADSKVGENPDGVAMAMKKIASKYTAKAATEPALLQDFNSLEEALNISAGDQRLLVILSSGKKKTEDQLRQVVSDPEILGRFHIDLVDGSSEEWKHLLDKQIREPGILVVKPGQFGLKGTVMKMIAENASRDQLRTSILEANRTFAKRTKRRDREEHIASGNRQGISYDLEKPDNARTEILRGGGKRRR